MTNEQWLKSLDTEELIEEIIGIMIKYAHTSMRELQYVLRSYLETEHKK